MIEVDNYMMAPAERYMILRGLAAFCCPLFEWPKRIARVIYRKESETGIHF